MLKKQTGGRQFVKSAVRRQHVQENDSYVDNKF